LKRTKIEFLIQDQTLAGLLETPEQSVRAYVLFAHCFTCAKDIAAAHFLEQHYQAPQLWVGHSLGSATVLAMTAQLQEVKSGSDH